MISDYTCAKLCWSCYNDIDIFDYVINNDHVWLGVIDNIESTILAFRGSVCFLDWWRDFEAFAIFDDQLGAVERGFLEGLHDVFAQLDKSRPMVLTGHSLGAAHAQLIGGLCIANNIEVDKIVVFGSPRPGYAHLKSLLQDTPVFSYKNRHDPVTDVPFTLPDFPYASMRDFIKLDAAPPDGDEWLFLADHHSELYMQALAKKD